MSSTGMLVADEAYAGHRQVLLQRTAGKGLVQDG